MRQMKGGLEEAIDSTVAQAVLPPDSCGEMKATLKGQGIDLVPRVGMWLQPSPRPLESPQGPTLSQVYS